MNSGTIEACDLMWLNVGGGSLFWLLQWRSVYPNNMLLESADSQPGYILTIVHCCLILVLFFYSFSSFPTTTFISFFCTQGL